MTQVLVTTWVSDDVPRTYSGSPAPGETLEEFCDRYVEDLRKIFANGCLPPDAGSTIKTVWETNGVSETTHGEEEGLRDFVDRALQELTEALASNPPEL